MPPASCFGTTLGVYAGSTLTLAVPADTRAGDVLFACLAGPAALTTPPPIGWELLATQSAASPVSRTAIYRRIADANEPAAHVFTVGVVAPQACGVLALYRGTDPSAALVASAQQAVNVASVSHPVPSVTLLRYSDATLLVYYAIDAAGTATLTPPANTTKLGAEAHGAGGSGGGSLAVVELLRDVTGAAGVQTGTWSTSAVGLAAAYVIQAVPTPTASALDDTVPGAIGLPVVGV